MEHRGIRWRLIRWATERRDSVQLAMDGAPAGSLTLARLLGRRDAFEDMISHVESGCVDGVDQHKGDVGRSNEGKGNG